MIFREQILMSEELMECVTKQKDTTVPSFIIMG